MRLRTVLSLMLAGLLIVTAGFIGWLGYSSSYRAIEHFTEQEFALANEAATQEVSNFLNDPANRLLDELSLRARRGMLSLKDDRALGLDLAERLRVNRTLAWISYGDAKTGHFVGAWRTTDSPIVLNISIPGHGEPREVTVKADGKESPDQRPRPKDYDPRDHPWFKNAMLADTTVWSEPYTFVDGVQRGFCRRTQGQPGHLRVDGVEESRRSGSSAQPSAVRGGIGALLRALLLRRPTNFRPSLGAWRWRQGGASDDDDDAL
jgi:hypothetical protein